MKTLALAWTHLGALYIQLRVVWCWNSFLTTTRRFLPWRSYPVLSSEGGSWAHPKPTFSHICTHCHIQQVGCENLRGHGQSQTVLPSMLSPLNWETYGYLDGNLICASDSFTHYSLNCYLVLAIWAVRAFSKAPLNQKWIMATFSEASLSPI